MKKATSKFWLTVISAALIIAASFYAYSLTLASKYDNVITISHLNSLIEKYSPEYAISDESGIKHISGDISKKYGVDITVYDAADGTIICDCSTNIKPDTAKTAAADIDGLVMQAKDYTALQDERGRVTVVSKIQDSDGRQLVIQMSKATNIFDSAITLLNQNAFNVAAAGVIFLLISVSCAVFIIFPLTGNLKLLSRQLQALNKMDSAIANVAHDIKSPLGIIRAYSEKIIKVDLERGDDIKIKRQLEIVLKETDRLNMLVGDILDYSRLKYGADLYRRSPFSVEVLFAKLAEAFQIIADNSEIKLEFNISGNPIIDEDEMRIEQVLHNFISNALHHTPRGGQVTISSTSDAGSGLTRLEVADNGCGIEARELGKIWDRFYKPAGSASSGTGLGLAIAREIFEAGGLNYGVQSKPGSGTAFWFEAHSSDMV